MSELHRHLEDYLRLRRALGFKLEFPGCVLPSLISYLQEAGAATVTADSWTTDFMVVDNMEDETSSVTNMGTYVTESGRAGANQA